MNSIFSIFITGLAAMCFASDSWALSSTSIETNAVKLTNAPSWLTENRVERVTAKLQDTLEWDIRKISVTFVASQTEFDAHHKLGPGVLAFTRKREKTIELGPRVINDNFDAVFGHELAHIIIGQKYTTDIPEWLEEGLCNWAAAWRTGSAKSKNPTIDYSWLSKQTYRPVAGLVHPFRTLSAGNEISDPVKYHYMASTALAEMLDKQCGMHQLLQLALKKGVTKYLSQFCEISDIDQSLKKWIAKKKP